MSGWVPLIAAGLQLVGGAMNAQGQQQGLEAQADAARYNAAKAETEARVEESRRRREASRQMGAIRAGRAKSGVTVSGTPTLVMAESAELAELDALSARWAGENSANLDRMRARSAKSAIPYAVGSSLLSGAAGAMRTYSAGT